MKQALLTAALLAACGLALAKLPPPDDAAKAKAAETAAKTAWQAKVDAYQLCKAQDRIVAVYAKKSGKPVPVASKAPASAVKVAATAPAPASTPATAASGTPVAAVVAAAPLPPCVDPGPFAYTPPEQKPLEASGAHSPAGTATGAPSVNKPAADMAPKKKS